MALNCQFRDMELSSPVIWDAFSNPRNTIKFYSLNLSETLVNIDQCFQFLWQFLFVAGECIKCVQCTTLKSRECEDGYVPPRECKPGMPYCIKYVGRLKAGKNFSNTVQELWYNSVFEMVTLISQLHAAIVTKSSASMLISIIYPHH